MRARKLLPVGTLAVASLLVFAMSGCNMNSEITHTLVSDLYVTATKEHLWQAVSETIQANSTEQVREDAIDSLIGNLKSQGLIR
ncbi:Uncharacterised protein [Halioglobus japonicus]|nr:Uncharacterised protein [Halioglobus japonicus]